MGMRVLSPRQLRRCSPVVLGLWLLGLVLAGFQPCAQAAEALVVAQPEVAGHPASHCQQGTGSSAEAQDACGDEHHYVHCNLPEVVKHDELCLIHHQPPAAVLQTAVLRLPPAPGPGKRRILFEHPPTATQLHLLASVRLLI